MPSRRQFLASAAVGVVSTTPLGRALSATPLHEPAPLGRLSVSSMKRRDETIVRYPSVNGDNWHLTWAADDRQYASMCDGYGWFEQPPGMYNSRLVSIVGSPTKADFFDVPHYPVLAQPTFDSPRYYNFGVISVDRRIYQFLSTWNTPITDDTKNLRFIGVKTIMSRDNGRTWCNQDGTSPVVWEDWKDRSSKNMLFFNEHQEAFSILSVLQMGKNYELNRDGYVYIYSPNGNDEGTMNQLVMFRVPTDRIADRAAYEYFAGLHSNGSPKWAECICDRTPVLTFPSGWVNKWLHPWAWIPSVAYNAPLGLYMMASWATAPSAESETKWFDKPSYLGFWVARDPWGPWIQVHEDTTWTPAGDKDARCYSAVIAPKWIAADGKSFWLVWTDFQQALNKDELERRRKGLEKLRSREKLRAEAELARINRPYYSFNVQRIDIDLR